MKISKILQELGLFSSDAKTRLKNGQIELNGEKIKEDVDINVLLLEDKLVVSDAGTFISQKIIRNEIWKHRCRLFGVEALWDLDNDLSKFFSDFIFLKISKREFHVIQIIK